VKVLVKVGGALLDAEDSRRAIAHQLAGLAADGVQVVVVHGGGKQMTRFLVERGIESRFVGGLRVTTPETLDAVLKVFAGSVNRELVAALIGAGAMAVGISGIDACLTEAEPMDAELGAVGRVVRSNPGLLEVLTANRYLPVVACVAGDRKGNIYNVNADQMAVACASAFGVRRLIFLTDVEGVLDSGKRLIPRLTLEEIERLIAEGTAAGGMLAKLRAATAAIQQGVSQVTIAPGTASGILTRLLDGAEAGTCILGPSEVIR